MSVQTQQVQNVYMLCVYICIVQVVCGYGFVCVEAMAAKKKKKKKKKLEAKDLQGFKERIFFFFRW